MLVLVGQESRHGRHRSSAQGLTGYNENTDGAAFHLEALQEKNVLPSSFMLLVEFISSCRAEGPGFLLAAGQRPASDQEGHPQFLATWLPQHGSLFHQTSQEKLTVS